MLKKLRFNYYFKKIIEQRDDMQCPYCADETFSSYKTKVIDSRHFVEPKRKRFYVERVRKCTKCQTTFSTTEYSPEIKHERVSS